MVEMTNFYYIRNFAARARDEDVQRDDIWTPGSNIYSGCMKHQMSVNPHTKSINSGCERACNRILAISMID